MEEYERGVNRAHGCTDLTDDDILSALESGSDQVRVGFDQWVAIARGKRTYAGVLQARRLAITAELRTKSGASGATGFKQLAAPGELAALWNELDELVRKLEMRDQTERAA